MSLFELYSAILPVFRESVTEWAYKPKEELVLMYYPLLDKKNHNIYVRYVRPFRCPSGTPIKNYINFHYIFLRGAYNTSFIPPMLLLIKECLRKFLLSLLIFIRLISVRNLCIIQMSYWYIQLVAYGCLYIVYKCYIPILSYIMHRGYHRKAFSLTC